MISSLSGFESVGVASSFFIILLKWFTCILPIHPLPIKNCLNSILNNQKLWTNEFSTKPQAAYYSLLKNMMLIKNTCGKPYFELAPCTLCFLALPFISILTLLYNNKQTTIPSLQFKKQTHKHYFQPNKHSSVSFDCWLCLSPSRGITRGRVKMSALLLFNSLR